MPHPAPPAITLPDPWVVGDIRLRPPSATDLPAVVDAVADPAIVRFTHVPADFTARDAHDFLDQAADDLGSSARVMLSVVDAIDNHLLGVVSARLDWRDATAEVGYWLAPAARGRGVATKAIRELARFTLSLGIGHVRMQVPATNADGVTLAERLGFSLEGTFRNAAIDGPSGDLDAPRVDLHQYGLLPGELR